MAGEEVPEGESVRMGVVLEGEGGEVPEGEEPGAESRLDEDEDGEAAVVVQPGGGVPMLLDADAASAAAPGEAGEAREAAGEAGEAGDRPGLDEEIAALESELSGPREVPAATGAGRVGGGGADLASVSGLAGGGEGAYREGGRGREEEREVDKSEAAAMFQEMDQDGE